MRFSQVLIAGCGDTGRHVARHWVEAGLAVTGLVNSRASAEALAAAGITPIQANLDEPLPSLPDAGLIYYFAPPARSGRDDPRLGRFLAALGRRQPQRVIYISTSGVYGDCNGAWVDEKRPVKPQTERAHRRVAAETRLAAWNGNWIILRAPGIYGPGRLPLSKLRAGEPVLADADCGWSNRIHVEDLARAAVVTATQGPDRQIYNVSDGHPTKMAAWYGALATALNVPPPPQIDWQTAQRDFSAMRLSFLAESRRLDNRKILQQTGLQLRYADFKDGIAASLAHER